MTRKSITKLLVSVVILFSAMSMGNTVKANGFKVFDGETTERLRNHRLMPYILDGSMMDITTPNPWLVFCNEGGVHYGNRCNITRDEYSDWEDQYLNATWFDENGGSYDVEHYYVQYEEAGSVAGDINTDQTIAYALATAQDRGKKLNSSQMAYTMWGLVNRNTFGDLGNDGNPEKKTKLAKEAIAYKKFYDNLQEQGGAPGVKLEPATGNVTDIKLLVDPKADDDENYILGEMKVTLDCSGDFTVEDDSNLGSSGSREDGTSDDDSIIVGWEVPGGGIDQATVVPLEDVDTTWGGADGDDDEDGYRGKYAFISSIKVIGYDASWNKIATLENSNEKVDGDYKKEISVVDSDDNEIQHKVFVGQKKEKKEKLNIPQTGDKFYVKFNFQNENVKYVDLELTATYLHDCYANVSYYTGYEQYYYYDSQTVWYDYYDENNEWAGQLSKRQRKLKKDKGIEQQAQLVVKMTSGSSDSDVTIDASRNWQEESTSLWIKNDPTPSPSPSGPVTTGPVTTGPVTTGPGGGTPTPTGSTTTTGPVTPTPTPTGTPTPSTGDIKMNLGGKVFLDEVEDKENNQGYTENTLDGASEGYGGVEVWLYRYKAKGGTPSGAQFYDIQLSGGDGSYLFQDLDATYKYYVKFVYNGMLYTTVEDASGSVEYNSAAWANTSKADEKSTERKAFNAQFKEIGSYPANYPVGNLMNCLVDSMVAKDGVYYNKVFKKSDGVEDLFKRLSAEVVNCKGNLESAVQKLKGSCDPNMLQYVVDLRMNAYTSWNAIGERKSRLCISIL